ncbi:MAG TPA: GEVED domain-containing protein, partial [Emticicia sp.]
DYNQNGVFEKEESIIKNASDLYRGTFTIPKDAKKGLTRIRVRATGSFLDLEEIINDACAKSSLGGETEDYTLYITDSTPAYSIEMDFTAAALCKTKQYTIPFSYTGEFSDSNIFRAALYNGFGQFIAYVGESKTSPVTVKFPDDLPIGHGYKLKMIASDFQYEGFFTKAFRINAIPTATISGNQKAYVGEPVFINVNLDGGGGWQYSAGNGGVLTIGYLPNKMNVELYAFPSSPPKPGVYNVQLEYVYNEACYEGTSAGSARIEILEVDKSPRVYRVFSDLQDMVYQQCRPTEKTVTFLTGGEFGKDNFFTCHLIGPDDKFVAAIGYSKTTKMLINIPKNIDGYGYKLKIVSSDPYRESLLSLPFTIAPIAKARLSGYSEILPGQQGTIQLDLIGEAPWQLNLSDGNTITTNIPTQELKVSPPKTETYSIVSVKDRSCPGEASGTATVKVLKRASAILVKKVPDICVGANMNIGFHANGAFREGNTFRLLLTDKNNTISKEIDSKAINDSTVYLRIPSDVPSGNGYNLRVISTNPYIESDTSYAFNLKPLSQAIISSEFKSVSENASVKLRVDFTGEGPFTIELSDGTQYKNIIQNPYFITIKATTGINRYTLKNVISSCGQGKVAGEVNLNVILSPTITTGLVNGAVCAGTQVHIPFIVSNTGFQHDNVFRIEISDKSGTDFKEIKSLNKGDSLFAQIEKDTPGGIYKVRVVSTNPVVVGSNSDLMIKMLPKATIMGGSKVYAGESARYFLTFSGDSPWTVRLSNGTELTNITADSIVVTYLPRQSETLTITSIKNGCGEGSFSGKAVFEIISILDKEEHQPLEAIENLVR